MIGMRFPINVQTHMTLVLSTLQFGLYLGASWGSGNLKGATEIPKQMEKLVVDDS